MGVTIAPAGAGQPPAPWGVYALGGFSVSCPGTPKAPSGQTATDPVRQWAFGDGSTSYAFSLTRIGADAAKAPAEALLRECINGLVASGKGTFESERDVLLEGWPGAEVRYQTPAGAEVALRAYVVKDQILSLIVSHPLASAVGDSVNRYFDSVKLPSDVPKGTLVEPGPKWSKFELESTGFISRVPPGVRSQIVKGDQTGTVEMHNFAAVYLNRTYMGFVVDPPPNAKLDLDNDKSGRPAEAVNATIAAMLQQKAMKTGSRDATAGKAWTLDFDAGHGLSGHIETYVRNNHTYSLLAVVPASMMGADEVKAFFDSVELPAKKS